VISKNITNSHKVQISRWYHKNLEFSENRNLFDNYISDMFTISAKYNNADTWFLLLISAIWAELRLVGVTCNFESISPFQISENICISILPLNHDAIKNVKEIILDNGQS
jgi:hypothetical protein